MTTASNTTNFQRVEDKIFKFNESFITVVYFIKAKPEAAFFLMNQLNLMDVFTFRCLVKFCARKSLPMPFIVMLTKYFSSLRT